MLGQPTVGMGRRAGLAGGGQRAGMGQRPAPAEGSDGGGRPPRGEGQKTTLWTTVWTGYDPYHSSLELQIMTEFYRTGLAIKMSPVYAEVAGPGTERGKPKYNHDESVMVQLGLPEAITFQAQLSAFLDGYLSQAEVVRDQGVPVKRLILVQSDLYYADDHPDAELHRGLAFSIEQEPSDKDPARSAVFISRPVEIQLDERSVNPEEPPEKQVTGPPVLFYPELQAMLAVFNSYIANCARVDFSSVRLLEQRAGGQERPAGGSLAQPVRLGRAGGAAAPSTGTAPPNEPGGSAPAVRGVAPPAGRRPLAGPQDIEAGLGGGTGAASDADIDAALNSEDAPKF